MRHFEPLRPNRSLGTPERYEFAHGKDSVCVYDIHTMEFIKEIPVGSRPDCHATTLSNKYLYIACVGGDLYIIDQDTLEVCKVLKTGPVYATNTLPDGNTMLVHDETGGILVIKDVDDMDKVHIHKRLGLLEEEAATGARTELGGKGHFMENGRIYLCAGWQSGKLFTLDLENDYAWELFRPRSPALVGGDDLVMNAEKTKAYIACHRASDPAMVAVVDLKERIVLKCLPTGRGTCGLTMTADERYVIASNDKDDSVSVIDTRIDEVVNTLSARKGFEALGLPNACIQGISAAQDDSIFVYECSGYGALVKFSDIAGKGKFVVSWKGGKHEGEC